MNTQCCVVGGGPAGMMLGYLLARAGVDTIVIEKHGDFLRDFRGDTVHPSTMQIMADLGLLDEFLKLPHSRVDRIDAWFGDTRLQIADFTRLKTPCPFIAFMPQWDFLNFLAEKGKSLPNLRILMKTEATELLREGGRVVGVRAKCETGMLDVRAALTVGADGRRSITRDASHLPLDNLGAPIDVLWFRVTRDPGKDDHDFGHIRSGRFLVTLDRGDYSQCAYVIRKGGADEVRAKGIEAFRKDAAETAPSLAAHIDDVKSFDDVKLLTVSVSMLQQWSSPGVLCIGDAAHTMSPVGGVGINLAVQDAVAAANILAPGLRSGTLSEKVVARVQRRRQFPARVVQAMQRTVHKRLLERVLVDKDPKPPAVMVLLRFRWVRGLLARFVGLGVRPGARPGLDCCVA